MNRVTAQSIEKAFVESYTGWSSPNFMALQLSNAKLAVDLGDFKAGDIVDCLILDFELSKIFIDNKAGKNLFTDNITITLAG